ncbi:MAG: ComEA family DNA-binding protein, partial [Bryobacteraceae bacterium]
LIEGAATTDIESFLDTNGLSSQASQVVNNFAADPPTSVLDFYVRSGLSESDFIKIEQLLMNSNTVGLININTATATALACIPGIGYNNARSVLAYRQSNGSRLSSVAWLKDALNNNTNAIALAGPWVTSHSFQFMADIAAVGHHGRGYRRIRFIFDTSSGLPQIVYRQDLTYLGWALGKQIHDQLIAQDIR